MGRSNTGGLPDFDKLKDSGFGKSQGEKGFEFYDDPSNREPAPGSPVSRKVVCKCGKVEVAGEPPVCDPVDSGLGGQALHPDYKKLLEEIRLLNEEVEVVMLNFESLQEENERLKKETRALLDNARIEGGAMWLAMSDVCRLRKLL